MCRHCFPLVTQDPSSTACRQAPFRYTNLYMILEQTLYGILYYRYQALRSVPKKDPWSNIPDPRIVDMAESSSATTVTKEKCTWLQLLQLIAPWWITASLMVSGKRNIEWHRAWKLVLAVPWGRAATQRMQPVACPVACPLSCLV